MDVGLSIQEQLKPINKELNVVFNPQATTVRYTYEIIKDGQKYDTVEVTNKKTVSISLSETGVYQIKVTEYSKNGISTIESGQYHLDLEKPIIIVQDESLTVYQMKKNENIDFSEYVRAIDTQDGNLTSKVTSNIADLDLTQIGLNQITFTVSDEAGNITTKTVPLNVVKSYGDNLIAIQIIIIAFLIGILFKVLQYRRSLSFEKRLAKYSVEPIRDTEPSLVDKITRYYQKILNRGRIILNKSVFLKRYSERYQKYLPIYHSLYQDGMDFITTKFLVAMILLIVAIFSKTIQYQIIQLYEVSIPLIFGFFLPDIIFFSKYKVYRNTLENDLLQAIIIMNNAFKSGRSITQAVDLVTKELKGPMCEEFKKMSMELSFGLAIDVVFKRFSKRINMEEVTYLTASLSILNKAGGNIIKVFSSIEKSLFDKKKLKLELASLTGSSKIIVTVLIAVPVLFIVFISLISPTYLTPLYTTGIGLVLSFFILIIYLIYIWLVRKIMKVRM